MEFTQVIKNRYSCKKYSDIRVETVKSHTLAELARVETMENSIL